MNTVVSSMTTCPFFLSFFFERTYSRRWRVEVIDQSRNMYEDSGQRSKDNSFRC